VDCINKLKGVDRIGNCRLYQHPLYSSPYKDDRALGLVGIGFTVGKNHWRFSLEGQGAYGANTTSHMIWGTATYDF